MNETIVTDHHLVAELSNHEYYLLRVLAAQSGITIKQWVSEAIRERLDGQNKKEDKH